MQGNTAIGRTKADAPEIDGIVTVKGAKGVKVGTIVRVRITGATEHDLAASIIR
jgi:ribosomal protein S12 methylthiotransferase